MAKTTFPHWLWNTFFIACASTAISLFCGLLAGYALGAAQVPDGRHARHLASSSPTWCRRRSSSSRSPNIIRAFQLGDTPWALILTYPTFLIPFCTWLLMGYFKTIPKELEECARIDGATRFGAMVRIIFPIAVPGILSAGIFAFTLSWNEFIYALDLPLLAREEDGPGRRRLGADPRRHLLLGPAHGGGAARLDPGRASSTRSSSSTTSPGLTGSVKG